MNRSKCAYLMAVVGIFTLVGCAAFEPIAPSKPLCITSQDRAEVMAVAEDVLTGMQFVIEKYDIDSGFIKTRPLRGGQMMELWRSDNVGAFNSAEANLHSIQRTVQLEVYQSTGQMCLRCAVNVRRLSLPEKDIISVSRMAGIFTGGRISDQRLKLSEEQKAEMAWIEMGAEPGLERKILGLIEKRIGKIKGAK